MTSTGFPEQDENLLVIRTVAMPADTNPAGDIFGGWLMSQMDLAAGNLASRVSQGRPPNFFPGPLLRLLGFGEEM